MRGTISSSKGQIFCCVARVPAVGARKKASNFGFLTQDFDARRFKLENFAFQRPTTLNGRF